MMIALRRLTFGALLAAAFTATTGNAQPARTATLRGVVYDSLAGAPLAGAVVQAASASEPSAFRTTTADSLGRFRIDSLAPGRWLVGFDHPTVAVLSLEMPTLAVNLASGDSTSHTLALPGPRALHKVLCGQDAGDSTSSIVGWVRDAESGAPVAGAKADVMWAEVVIENGIQRVVRRVPVQIRDGGKYLICGLPSDADLVMRAESPGMATGEVAVPIRGGGLTRLDLDLGAVTGSMTADSVTRWRGAARLTGSVVDPRGRPVSGARVLLLGVQGLGATTNETGTFTLDSLPAGTWTAEARAIGYEPTRRTVHLSRQHAAVARVDMPKRVATLQRVVVRGTLSRTMRAMNDAMDRASRLGGKFLSPDEVERRHAIWPSDLFRSIAGLQVIKNPTGANYVIRGRGGCTPDVFVDGMRIQDGADDIDTFLQPGDVMAVEIYRGLLTPIQFNSVGKGGCGSLVIWTKTG